MEDRVELRCRLAAVSHWIGHPGKHMRVFQFLAGFLSAGGAIAAAIGVWFQFAAYQEEGFVRRYGAVSLAWTIVKDGNGTDHDIGQGAALQFLSDEIQLQGNVSLDNSFMFSSVIGSPGTPANLSSSTFCRTSFMFVSMIGANISQSNFSNAIVTSVFMSDVRGYGSRFDNALLMQIQASGASFVASSFVGAKIYGGNFRGSDFSGADLRNLITNPLLTSPERRRDVAAVRRPFDQKISNAEALSAIEPNLLLASEDAAETPVDFADANFEHADIRGADLRGSNISQRQVDLACADETTQLPGIIKPKAACGGEDWATSRRTFLQTKGGRRVDPPACSTTAQAE